MKRLFEVTNKLGYVLAWTYLQGRLRQDFGNASAYVDNVDPAMVRSADGCVLEIADGIWHGTFNEHDVVLYARTYNLVGSVGLMCYAYDLPARAACLSHYANKRPPLIHTRVLSR